MTSWTNYERGIYAKGIAKGKELAKQERADLAMQQLANIEKLVTKTEERTACHDILFSILRQKLTALSNEKQTRSILEIGWSLAVGSIKVIGAALILIILAMIVLLGYPSLPTLL